VEQSTGRRHGDQCTYFGTATGFPEDRYVAWVASKMPDVPSYPLERSHNIELSCIAGACEAISAMLGQVRVSEKMQTVIDRHHHDVASPG
jgi:hypothetical protein